MRSQRQLSQTDLAHQVGVTFQQIQKYEKGTNRISASRLYEFALVFGVPVQEFFAGIADAGDDEAAAVMAVPQPSRLDYDILRLLGQLQNGQVKQRLRGVLQAFAADDDHGDASD